MSSCGFQGLCTLRCRFMYFSTTGSSSRNKSRSCGSGTVSPRYLCLSVSVNISVYAGDIQVPILVRLLRVVAAAFLVRCGPAEQHVYAVVDELFASGGQSPVQVGGEQRRQAADQAGGDHLLSHRIADLRQLVLQQV